jgi:hypothetical protein
MVQQCAASAERQRSGAIINSPVAVMRQVGPTLRVHIRIMGFWHTLAIDRRGWARFLSIAAGCIPSDYLSAKFGLAWYWTAPMMVTTAVGMPLARAACRIGNQPPAMHWSHAIRIIAMLTGASVAWPECGLGWRWCALGSGVFVAVPVLMEIVWTLHDRRHAQRDRRVNARRAQDNVGGLGRKGRGKGLWAERNPR